MIVHKFMARKSDRFNLPDSNAAIYLNSVSGLGLLIVSIIRARA